MRRRPPLYTRPDTPVPYTTPCRSGADSPRARRAAYARVRVIVAESMAPFAARLPGGLRQPRLLGISGTVTTLASVHLKLDRYDRSAVDGLIVPAAARRRISADLSGL